MTITLTLQHLQLVLVILGTVLASTERTPGFWFWLLVTSVVINAIGVASHLV